MLLEFSCSNHKSIGDKIIFSLIAGSDTFREEKNFEFGKYKVLPSAVIYGANGSGKSNFIDAVSFVKNLVINSINHQPGQGIRQIPHKLIGLEKESTYQIHFVVKGIIFVFGFSLKNLLVTEEYLYYFPKGKQAKIFERDENGFSTGSKFTGKFNACKDVLKPNRLMLSCAANFSSVPEIDDAYRFFLDELVVYHPSMQERWMNYSIYQMNTDSNIKSAVITLLKELGTGIKDIEVNIDQQKIETMNLPPFLSDDFKKMLLQQQVDAITAKVVYDDFETDLFSEESTGIQKLFGMLCPLIDIMKNGKVLVCDEIESGLHESLIYELIRKFVDFKSENFAQLIFTTHETGLLSLDSFRRDQIWFAEMKTADRSTDLYSLAEIKNIRKEENFGKGYISGKYGAIPMLNVDFANVVEKIH